MCYALLFLFKGENIEMCGIFSTCICPELIKVEMSIKILYYPSIHFGSSTQFNIAAIYVHSCKYTFQVMSLRDNKYRSYLGNLDKRKQNIYEYNISPK